MEDLVDCLRSGKPVQIACVRIQDFEQSFNRCKRQPRSPDAGLGYLLGDVAIDAFGEVLDLCVGRGAVEGDAVYNDGPTYYVVSTNGDRALASRIAHTLESATFKRNVWRRLQDHVDERLAAALRLLPGDRIRGMADAFGDLDSSVVRMTAGVSAIHTAGPPTALPEAVAVARRLTTEAFRAGQLLRFSRAGDVFTAALRAAILLLKSGASRSVAAAQFDEAESVAAPTPHGAALAIDSPIGEGPLAEACRIVEEGLQRSCRSPAALIDTLMQTGLRRPFFVDLHLPFSVSHWREGSYRDLIDRHEAAVAAGDPKALTKTEEMLLYKWLSHRRGVFAYRPVIRANNHVFRVLLHFLVRHPPAADCRIVMHRGADELAVLDWRSDSDQLCLQKFDVNDMTAILNEHGPDAAMRLGERMAQLLFETRDPREFISRSLACSLSGTNGSHEPSPGLCGAGVRLNVRDLSPESRVRDLGFIEERADRAFLLNKQEFKAERSRSGRADPSLAYTDEQLVPNPSDMNRLPDFTLSKTDVRIARHVLDRCGMDSTVAIEKIASNNVADCGFDIIVLVCARRGKRRHWLRILDHVRGSAIASSASVLVVDSEGPEAGSGIDWGTVAAVRKAAASEFGMNGSDLLERLARGASIVVVHTAGMGKRLAPITIVEGAKSSAWVPMIRDEAGRLREQSVVEAVLRSSRVWATSRKGRLTVLPGDQVIIGSDDRRGTRMEHVEIFCVKKPIAEIPSHCGVLGLSTDGCVRRYATGKWTAEELQRDFAEADLEAACSLGAYSISREFLRACMEAFPWHEPDRAAELRRWPLIPALVWAASPAARTAPNPSRVSPAILSFHEALEERLGSEATRRIGYKDLGAVSVCWDYGRLDSYRESLLKVVQHSSEGDIARRFYDVTSDDDLHRESHLGEADVVGSLLQRCSVDRGRIVRSVVIDFQGGDVDIENSVVVGGCVGRLRAKDAIVYKAIASELELIDGIVAEASSSEKGPIRLQAELSRDPKDDWTRRLSGDGYSNQLSYAEACEIVTAASCPSLDVRDDEHANVEDDPRRLWRLLDAADNVSLVLLKGGAWGGMRLRRKILARLAPWFDVVHGRIRDMAASEVVARWIRAESLTAYFEELTRHSELKELLNAQREFGASKAPERDVEELLATLKRLAADQISARLLAFAIEYMTSRCQHLLLRRRGAWEELARGFGAPTSEGANRDRDSFGSLGPPSESERIKRVVVGHRDPFEAHAKSLRGDIVRRELEAGLLEELHRRAQRAGVDDRRWLALLANSIHCCAGRELEIELQLLDPRDVTNFCAALNG